MENDSVWMSQSLALEAQNDMLRKEVELLSKSNFDMVKEFHRAFNKQKDPEVPTLPDQDTSVLRIRLVAEEFQEALEELGFVASFEMNAKPTALHPSSVDLVKLAKELADLLYVVYGFAAAFGIDVDAVFREVHRSNMSKLGEDGKPIYREDGKVLKGPNYTPPDIERILYPDWVYFNEK
jgi:predicted HAD superfamily Cof-like phosphohydrolase